MLTSYIFGANVKIWFISLSRNYLNFLGRLSYWFMTSLIVLVLLI